MSIAANFGSADGSFEIRSVKVKIRFVWQKYAQIKLKYAQQQKKYASSQKVSDKKSARNGRFLTLQ
ncbi:hypothetical protein AC739_03180 [Planococcus glaciei]|nr:hypothetical protein AC739_03180 [Planococcus glaciei]